MDEKDTVVVGENSDGQPINAAGEVVETPPEELPTKEEKKDTAKEETKKTAKKSESQLPENEKKDSHIDDLESLPISQGIESGEEQAAAEKGRVNPEHIQAREE